MSFALISDIHGYAPALEQALAVINEELAISEIFCLGDIIDGAGDDDRCCEIIRQQSIPSVQGNHDDIHGCTLDPEHAAWLHALPDRLLVHGWECYHFSPRLREERIGTAVSAWNSFDDCDFQRCAVGHAHAPGVYVFDPATPLQCTELAWDPAGWCLDPQLRYLAVIPSLAYNKLPRSGPGFAVIDGDHLRFHFLNLPPAPGLGGWLNDLPA